METFYLILTGACIGTTPTPTAFATSVYCHKFQQLLITFHLLQPYLVSSFTPH